MAVRYKEGASMINDRPDSCRREGCNCNYEAERESLGLTFSHDSRLS